jgi:hypothetical protein
VYAIGRVDWSFSKLMGRSLSGGIVKDFGLLTGFDFGSKNDTFAQGARVWTIGPSISFNVPHGFLNASLGWRKEQNHNGFVGRGISFDPTWYFESTGQVSFNLGPAPMLFRGFVSVTGPKGRDGFGIDSKTELMSRFALLADVGHWFGNPRAVYAGLGYMYWYQEYGVPSGSKPGTLSSVPMLQLEAHF